MSCIFQEQNTGYSLQASPFARILHLNLMERMMAVAKLQDATWKFQAAFSSQRYGQLPQGKALCNYTMADEVGSLQFQHERLCHTCPQYLKTMVDKGLVRGMMLTKREHRTCDACHLGKQKRQTHWKKLDREKNEPNQVVYADLQITGTVECD